MGWILDFTLTTLVAQGCDWHDNSFILTQIAKTSFLALLKKMGS